MKIVINRAKISLIARLIYEIATDEEAPALGIPKVDKELEDIGFTSKERNNIIWGVYETMSRLSKKI